jgi:hypothetical protein
MLCCVACLRQSQLADLEDSDDDEETVPQEEQARLVMKMLEAYTDDEDDQSQSDEEEFMTKPGSAAGDSTAESDNDGAGAGGSESSLVTSEAEDEGKALTSHGSHTNSDDDCENRTAPSYGSFGPHPSKRGGNGDSYDPSRLRAVSDARVAYMQTQRQLQPSPTSWAAQMRLRRRTASLASADHAADMSRAARALLNKLTIDRFEVLCAQVLALPLETEDHLSALVEEIFKKATTEQGFCGLYADLCLRIDSHLSVMEESEIGGRCFRRILLNACQVRFQEELQCAADTKVDDLEGEELFEMQMKLKRGRLGNMRFVGELLNRKLLASRVLIPVCHDLLQAADASPVDTVAAGAALESLVALLHVVGPHFHDCTSPMSMALNDVFATLRGRTQDETLASRIRFLIRDLLDLRSKDWQTKGTSRQASVKNAKDGRKVKP